MSTRALAAVLVALLAYVYVTHYLRFSREYAMELTWLRDTGPATLASRVPVFIMDRVVDDDALARTLFRYAHVSRRTPPEPTGDRRLRLNTAKYCVLLNPSGDAPLRLNLVNPRFSPEVVTRPAAAPRDCHFSRRISPYTAVPRGVRYVEVVLHPRQSLILPMWWYWQPAGAAAPRATYYHDPVSWAVALVAGLRG